MVFAIRQTYIPSTSGQGAPTVQLPFNLLASSDAASVTALNVNKTGTGSGAVIAVANAGTGNGLFIDQNSDAVGLNIDSEATGNQSLQITGKYGAYFSQDITNGWMFKAIRNLNEAGSAPLAYIICDHTANTQPALEIQQDGSAYGITFTGANAGAADIHLLPKATAGMGAGAEGDLYYDSTLHKLRIRTAGGYETITSA